ncbi:MAG: prepilin-type N-terminal cleavage/methylation domain-containing protein [Nitrospirota bacterium]
MLRIKHRTGMGPQRAFTIIELIVVISIMAIVIGIASVTIANALRQARLRDTTRELQGELGLIRNKARTLQRTVVTEVTASSIRAFYDMSIPSDKVYTPAVDFIDENNNLVYDAGVDTDGLFFQHAYANGIQFTVTSIPGVGAVVPLTTFRYNTAGNIDDANRVITVRLNSEPLRQYRIWVFTTGATRVERSEDAGVTWPTRPW